MTTTVLIRLRYSFYPIGLRAFFLFVVFFSLTGLGAQIPINYTINDGLPSLETYKIVQDHDGYIWVGTDRGVSRYDGYEFKNYTSNDGLPNNLITDLHVDSGNRIWLIGAFHQPTFIHQGKLHHVALNPKDEELLKKIRLQRVMELSPRKILLIYHRRLVYAYDPIEKTFTKEYDFKDHEKFKPLMFQLESGQWLSIMGENSKLNTRFDSLTTLTVIKEGKEGVRELASNVRLKRDRIVAYVEYGDSILCILPRAPHLYLITNDSLVIARTFPNEITSKFGYDANGDLWIPLFKNGLRLYPKGKISVPPKKLLTDYSITSRLVDREGNVWHSTLSNGVLFTPNEKFHYAKIKSFGGNQIRSFHGIGESVFLVTERGQLIDIKKNKPPRPFANQKISLIHPFSADEILISEHYGATWKYHLKTKNKEEFSSHSLRTFLLSKDELFVAHNRKLRMIKDGQVSVDFRVRYNFYATVYSLAEFNNSVYIGTFEGLYQFKNDSLKYLGKKHPLFAQRISGLVNLNDTVLAISSLGSGIMFLQSNGNYQIANQSKGLPSNMLNGLFLSEQKELWSYGSEGATQYLPPYNDSAIHFSSITYQDGLGWHDVIGMHAHGDTIWVASRNGITQWNKNDQNRPRHQPVIKLEQFTVNNELREFQTSPELSFEENNITINFKGISHRSRKKVKYEYRFSNLNSDWSSSTATSVHFPKLGPGEYHFEVKAVDAWNQTSKETAKLNFVILAPFWQRWWFIAFAILLVSSVVIGLFYWRVKTLNQRIELMQHWYHSKHLSLNAQMNPHFIFNSLGAIQHYLLNHDAKLTSTYLAGFAKLMRHLLENGKSYLVSLQGDIKALKEYVHLEELRFPNRFEVYWHTDSNLKLAQLQVPPMLLQPFIENSIQHGLSPLSKKGRLNITYQDAGDYFNISVEDNGIGRKESLRRKQENGQHSSSGMAISEERLSLLNKMFQPSIHFQVEDLEDDQSNPIGTCVRFSIPKKLTLKPPKQLVE